MAAVIVDVRPTSPYAAMTARQLAPLLGRVFCHLAPPEQYGIGEALLGQRVQLELHDSRPPEMFRGAALEGTLVAVAHPLGDGRPVLVLSGDADRGVVMWVAGQERARPETTSVSAYWVRRIGFPFVTDVRVAP